MVITMGSHKAVLAQKANRVKLLRFMFRVPQRFREFAGETALLLFKQVGTQIAPHLVAFWHF